MYACNTSTCVAQAGGLQLVLHGERMEEKMFLKGGEILPLSHLSEVAIGADKYFFDQISFR